MDRLDRLAAYFNEKEKKRLSSLSRNTQSGLPEMTEDEVKLSCLENNGYESPELNDKLYLHFRGFKKIENLDKYTGCKAIWLDSNGFSKIENLHMMTQLRCLYLSKNLINKIEGLECLQQLIVLDLSNNHLTKLGNLSCCSSLQTLNVSRNALADVESIEHVKECLSLTTLDITNNRLPAEEDILSCISAFSVSSISINGNEVTKLPSYRKRLITNMPKLGYLDRPIDTLERSAAEAFVQGGPEAEMQIREDYRNQQKQQKIDEIQAFKKWQKEHQEKRRQEIAERGQNGQITVMTSEEEDERRREAKQAAETERKALGMGIGNLANKYYQLEAAASASGKYNNADLLDQAMEEMVSESQRHETVDDAMSVPPLPVPTEHAAPIDNSMNELLSRLSEITPVDPETVALVKEAINSNLVESCDPVQDDDAGVNRISKEEEEEEKMRLKLIQDSVNMYKQQKEQGSVTMPNSTVSTWDQGAPSSVVNRNNVSISKAGVLYWSESMDIMLAQLVRELVFDFDEISVALSKAAESGKFGVAAQLTPELLSSDECRLRWAALDANQWGDMGPDSGNIKVNYTCYVNPSVIQGKGHGGQPTYQALKSLAASSMPAYLNVPVSFPTINSDDASDDEVENNNHINNSNEEVEEEKGSIEKGAIATATTNIPNADLDILD